MSQLVMEAKDVTKVLGAGAGLLPELRPDAPSPPANANPPPAQRDSMREAKYPAQR